MKPTWYRLQRLGATLDEIGPEAFFERYNRLPFSHSITTSDGHDSAEMPSAVELEAIEALLEKNPKWPEERDSYLKGVAPHGESHEEGLDDCDGLDFGNEPEDDPAASEATGGSETEDELGHS